MTEHKTPEQWEAERIERDKKRCAAFEKLEADQKDAIRQAIGTLEDCLEMLHEYNDLYLSDVSRLEKAFYGLKNKFPPKDA
tara:strand:- start:3948 stop:4190 length:243 start_codon:yes stop_codon:yes gene_type:complete